MFSKNKPDVIRIASQIWNSEWDGPLLGRVVEVVAVGVGGVKRRPDEPRFQKLGNAQSQRNKQNGKGVTENKPKTICLYPSGIM